MVVILAVIKSYMIKDNDNENNDENNAQSKDKKY